MNSSTSEISSGSIMPIGTSPSLARTNSRIGSTLGASSEMAPHQGGTSKPLLSLRHWYLLARYTRLRPRTPTTERAALVARKQIAGLLLADIVLNNLANRRSCCERKFSLPTRPGSKTLLGCMGKQQSCEPLSAIRHTITIRCTQLPGMTTIPRGTICLYQT